MSKPISKGLSELHLSAAFMIGAAVLGSVIHAQAQAPAAPAPVATPKSADGHPVLSGFWVPGGPTLQNGFASEAEGITFAGRGGTFRGFEEDGGVLRANDPNKPIYKPEFWEVVRHADAFGNWEDPQNWCSPAGLPRIGAPARIVELPTEILLFYNGGFTFDRVRSVKLNAQHNKINVALETWYGDSVAKWNGDVLEIETIGFTDSSWLHKNGWIHGFGLKVVERLTRTGNQLRWEATVEDPEYLQEPWKPAAVVRNLNTDPDAWLAETLPCDERDRQLTTSPTRSG